MTVDTRHPSYNDHIGQWLRIRDVLAGADAVKSKGTTYLPMPGGQNSSDYAEYAKRAEFYPAAGRTVDGLQGAIFRREPHVEAPDKIKALMQSVSIKGLDFVNFAKQTVREILTLGRYGVLVDVAKDGGDPFVTGYIAENILNWHVSVIGRRPMLTFVALSEKNWTPSPDNPYESKPADRIRILQLGETAESPGNMIYFQELWERQKNKRGGTDWVQIDATIPKRRGESLDFIPFTFFGPTDLTPSIQKSPILDLADTNLSHYRTSAELEEGAYFTGLPMYVVSGRPQGGENQAAEFVVGSRRALFLEEGGSAQVLTVSGDGMGILVKLMEAKEQRMAILGARILEDQKAGVEAAATVAMRHRGENSLLSDLSDTAGRGLSVALDTMAWWAGGQDIGSNGVLVQLNKDFMAQPLTPQELVQLTAAWQQGGFGSEVMFKALKDGERLPDGWTTEDWQKDIEESGFMGGSDWAAADEK